MSNFENALKSAQALKDPLPGNLPLKFSGSEYEQIRKSINSLGNAAAVISCAESADEMPSLEAILVAALANATDGAQKDPRVAALAKDPDFIAEWVEKVLARTKTKSNGDGDGAETARVASRRKKPVRKNR